MVSLFNGISTFVRKYILASKIEVLNLSLVFLLILIELDICFCYFWGKKNLEFLFHDPFRKVRKLSTSYHQLQIYQIFVYLFHLIDKFDCCFTWKNSCICIKIMANIFFIYFFGYHDKNGFCPNNYSYSFNIFKEYNLILYIYIYIYIYIKFI